MGIDALTTIGQSDYYDDLKIIMECMLHSEWVYATKRISG